MRTTLFILPMLFFGSSCLTSKRAYERGFADGEANEAKRAYWTEKDTITADQEPHDRQVVVEVPEHTTADGIIIEAHTRTIESD